jgi:glycosyltransferase involved in cell wall biosynthesis
MPHPKIAVVIPCYNTSAHCVSVIARAAEHAGGVLAVDDGSTDDTAEHLASSGCAVVRLERNSGKGAALKAGIVNVLEGRNGRLREDFDYVVTLDGDGQHDPADIPRLVGHAMATGSAIVIGMRDPRAMPPRSRIGSHFSRLLFLIGTGQFVADTQSGFRLFARASLPALLASVTWRGYETESEVLGKALALGYDVSAVEIPAIYLDGNRRTQFRPWRDSTRIASVFRRQLAWTVSMAMLDFAAFAVITLAGWLSPVRANVASRAIAVLCQALGRRDYAARTRMLIQHEGLGSVALAFAGHLALTTSLVAIAVQAGMPPIVAKAGAQLVGYLATFAAVDYVLLRRTMGPARPRTREAQGRAAAGS